MTSNQEKHEDPFFLTAEIEAEMRAEGVTFEPEVTHHRTASIRELFGWKPGESFLDAVARKHAGEP
jgi:hypothetical protein